MPSKPPEASLAALELEPHADTFLGSPFWNAILHRSTNDAEDWRSSRWFWVIDGLFRAAAMLWLRWYLHRQRTKEAKRL
jgi:hypothetical protein